MDFLPYIDASTVMHRSVTGCGVKVTLTTTFYIKWGPFRVPYRRETRVF